MAFHSFSNDPGCGTNALSCSGAIHEQCEIRCWTDFDLAFPYSSSFPSEATTRKVKAQTIAPTMHNLS